MQQAARLAQGASGRGVTRVRVRRGARPWGVPVVGGVMALVLLTAAPTSTAPATHERSLAELAEAYRAGDRDAAVVAVSLLSRERIEGEVLSLRRKGVEVRARREYVVPGATER